ncbi:MAG TPA: ankyrin repeat domain-containing protein, partial [Candidatus Wallbacteria bacterium]|nr:ankyrin repeat domain-containing protein [Candidatus Wallbacteria bacterium]
MEDYGYLGLIWAIDNGYADIAKLQLEKGIDVNARDGEGMTPLMHAAIYGNREIVKMLLDKGADASVKDGEGFSALMFAISKKNNEIIDILKLYDQSAGFYINPRGFFDAVENGEN